MMLEDGLETEDIVDLECHRSANVCVVTTSQDGLAVIGRSHDVTWLTGTSSTTWSTVTCADPTLNECTAFGLGGSTMTIMGHRDRFEEFHRPHPKPQERGIGMSGASIAAAGTTLVHLSRSASSGMTRSTTKPTSTSGRAGWRFDTTIAGRSLAWSVGSGMGTGWFLTTDGDLVGMVPGPFRPAIHGAGDGRRHRCGRCAHREHPRSDIHEQSKLQAAYIRRRNARRSVSAEGYGACNRSLERSPPRSTGGLMEAFEAPDFYDIESLLTEEEIMIRDMVRDWVDEEVLPDIEHACRDGVFLDKGAKTSGRWACWVRPSRATIAPACPTWPTASSVRNSSAAIPAFARSPGARPAAVPHLGLRHGRTEAEVPARHDHR